MEVAENGDVVLDWAEIADLTHAKQAEYFGWCMCEDNDGQENPFSDCPKNYNYTWERPYDEADPNFDLFGAGMTAMVTDYMGTVVAYCHIDNVLAIVEGLRGDK